MTDPILVLALGASVLAMLSFILSRVIPDDYDRSGSDMRLQKVKHTDTRR